MISEEQELHHTEDTFDGSNLPTSPSNDSQKPLSPGLIKKRRQLRYEASTRCMAWIRFNLPH